MSRPGPGLTGVLALWAMWIAVSAATWATNARVPVSELYGFHGAGIVSAAGRVVVLLGWPIALAAIPLMAVSVERFLAGPHSRRSARVVAVGSIASIGLCATIAWPGAQQGHAPRREIQVHQRAGGDRCRDRLLPDDVRPGDDGGGAIRRREREWTLSGRWPSS